MVRRDIHQANRLAWNEATKAHNSHKNKQAEFLRDGGSTLFPEEIALLKSIKDKTLLHLQCNSGQDSLSLARLGAHVTGVDISDVAIEFAVKLAADSGIRANFVRSDLYDWFKKAAKEGEQFQIVFSSYGTLVWLSDINKWADGVSNVLEDGGRLVLIDFHPFMMIFEWDWTLTYPYFGNGEPLQFEDGIGDYVAMSGESLTPSGYLEGITDFKNPFPVKEFQWAISDIVSAILGAGLIIEEFREYPYMNGAHLFKSMQNPDYGRMYPPPGFPNLPLMYGLVAIKE